MFIGFGTLLNVTTVLAGSAIGLLVGHRLPQRTRDVVTDGLELVTLMIAALSTAAVLDGAFVAERCEAWCNLHGMRRRVVERDPAQKGFVVLERRWVVERSFGRLVHWGGLLRDRAGRLDVSAARLACVGVLSGLEALINPEPIQTAAS